MTGFKNDSGKLEYSIGVYYVSKSNFGVGQKVDEYTDFSFLKKENFDAFIEKVKALSLSDEEKEKLKYAKPFVQTLFSKNNELSSHRFCLQSVCYQTCFVNFIRSFVAQPLMNPFTIEELYKFPETFSQFLCT